MPLFIVAVPIGNPDDITLRAVKTLREADLVICEEFKVGQKLLKRLDITNELITLNEHNEEIKTEEIIQLLLSGKKIALFSDAGTPLFADPGTILVQRCHYFGLQVIPVPGPSSIIAALSVAGVNTRSFHYAGFLSRQTAIRQKEIRDLGSYACPVVIMDTPYRLKAVLEDIQTALGPKINITLALSLTQPGEKIIKGPVSSVLQETKKLNKKMEFVLIMEKQNEPRAPRKKQKKHYPRRQR